MNKTIEIQTHSVSHEEWQLRKNWTNSETF